MTMTVTVKNAAGPYIGRLRVFNREADGSGTEIQAEEKVLLPGQEATVTIWDRRYFSVDEIGEAPKSVVLPSDTQVAQGITQTVSIPTSEPVATSTMPAGPADPAE